MGVSEIGWLWREAPPPIDATARFLELYAEPPRIELPVLLVGGIFTGLYPGYLRAVRRHLNAREVPTNTAAGTVRNARAIRDAVRGACVLVGQSKGPLDIHAALSLHPELARDVRAFVSIQAPFGGTPMATDAEAVPLLRSLAGRSGYFEMGYAQRREFLRAHSPLSPAPAVALGTRVRRAGIFLEKTRQYLSKRYAVENDGFVPLPDAHIPGAKLVRLDGVDHAAIALRWLRPSGAYDPGRLVQALIALALEGPE